MRAKQIVVYDTFEKDCKKTAEALREYFGRTGIKAVVNEFTLSEDFVYDFRDHHYDMAFVSIGSMLDMEAARAVRGLDESCPLFLVSHLAEYALEGYRINALDYIVKPVTWQRVKEAVSRAEPVFRKCSY